LDRSWRRQETGDRSSGVAGVAGVQELLKKIMPPANSKALYWEFVPVKTVDSLFCNS
jgi:hypothetical protein